jgi:hypothetical protein
MYMLYLNTINTPIATHVSFYLVWFIVPNDFPNQIIHLFFIFSDAPSFRHVLCQITMSDLMMNVHTSGTDNTSFTMLYVKSNMSDLMMHVHTSFTDNTIYTMVYVRSLCQI